MMDVAIVGGGLAGMALAWELNARGVSVTVFDEPRDVRRASAVPVAMAHLFAGRSFKPSDKLLDSFWTTKEVLERWRALAPQSVRPQPMWRPLLKDDRSSAQLLESWERERAGLEAVGVVVERVGPEQTQQALPWLVPSLGALRYGPAWSVSVDALLDAVRAELMTQGTNFISERVDGIEATGKGVTISTTAGRRTQAARVALCPGAALGDWFPNLQGAAFGGELLVLEDQPQQGPTALVSAAGGYVSIEPGVWACGATRWPVEQWSQRTDAQAAQDLTARARRLIPSWPHHDKAKARIWRGARWLFMGDRLPVVGQIPHSPRVYVLGALGSRGLLWGPWSARCLAALICDNTPIPQRISLERSGKTPTRWLFGAALMAL